ncbi:MAG TPA: hypothetical protein EYP39_03705, partial [Ghiorsea sp.]|nr:hypothetical protein [Ghiorsea sp.]
MADNKAKALETALAQIEKQFGSGTIMRMGDKAHVDVEVIGSGSLALDAALGIGGYPRGRIVEIDHVLPFSRSLEDGMHNKVVKLKNIKKGSTIALRNIFFDSG